MERSLRAWSLSFVGLALTMGTAGCGSPPLELDGGSFDAAALDGGTDEADASGPVDGGVLRDAETNADGGAFDAASGADAAVDAALPPGCDDPFTCTDCAVLGADLGCGCGRPAPSSCDRCDGLRCDGPGPLAVITGDAGALAVRQLPDLGPFPSYDVDDDGWMRRRLTALLEPGVTLGALNDALAAEGVRISSAAPGSPYVTLDTRRFASRADADATAERLTASDAFALVSATAHAGARLSPGPGTLDDTPALTRSRFPGLWNARATFTERVAVRCTDEFGAGTPPAQLRGLRFGPGSVAFDPAVDPRTDPNHGFWTMGILAGAFDAIEPTGGASPLRDLDLVCAQSAGMDQRDAVRLLLASMPAAGPSVVNASVGYLSPVQVPTNGAMFYLHTMFFRENAIPFAPRMLVFAAAGNGGDEGVTSTELTSVWGIEARVSDLRSLLTPAQRVAVEVAHLASLARQPALNSPMNVTLLVGASDETGVEESYSQRPTDVRMVVGTGVSGACTVPSPRCGRVAPEVQFERGTSAATPLSASAAAIFWSMVPTASPGEIAGLLRSHVDDGYIDVFGAALDFERDHPERSVRFALLDMDDDDVFDDADVAAFLAAYDASAGARDHSRADLNGDGTTGDSGTSFDLDLSGGLTDGGLLLTLFGDTEYYLDEANVNDLDVMCAYANTPVFRGDTERRDALLRERCISDPIPCTTSIGWTGTLVLETTTREDVGTECTPAEHVSTTRFEGQVRCRSEPGPGTAMECFVQSGTYTSRSTTPRTVTPWRSDRLLFCDPSPSCAEAMCGEGTACQPTTSLGCGGPTLVGPVCCERCASVERTTYERSTTFTADATNVCSIAFVIGFPRVPDPTVGTVEFRPFNTIVGTSSVRESGLSEVSVLGGTCDFSSSSTPFDTVRTSRTTARVGVGFDGGSTTVMRTPTGLFGTSMREVDSTVPVAGGRSTRVSFSATVDLIPPP